MVICPYSRQLGQHSFTDTCDARVGMPESLQPWNNCAAPGVERYGEKLPNLASM